TTSITDSSPTSSTTRPTSLPCSRSRATVSSGVARTPEGSLAATPTRTSPTSMPRRTPLRMVGSGTDLALDRRQGVLDPARVLAAALGEVVLAAPTAAEGPGRDPHERAGLDPLRPGCLVRRDDDDRLAGAVPGEGDDHGTLLAQPTPRVGDHAAQVVPAAAGDVLADVGDSGDVGRRVGEGARRCGHLLTPDLLELPLDLAQPADHLRDPLREVFGGCLDDVRELGDERALGREVLQGVHPDEGLEAAHPGPDRGLPREGERTDLAGVAHVGPAAELARPRAADLDDPDLFVVGLTEEGQRPLLARLREAHPCRGDGEVVAHSEVCGVLD